MARASSLRMSPKPTPAQKKALLVKLAVAALVLLVGAVLVLRGLDLRALLNDTLTLMRDVGPEAFFGAMAVLPAGGFPMSPFWLSAAPVFSPMLGLPLVISLCGLSLAVNLAMTYWLARYAFRPPLVWLVQRLGYALPKVAQADHVSVSVLVRVTPGPPFCVQGYLLGLAEIPFRTYMLVSWPIAMAFGVVFIYFGDSLAQGKGKLALLAFCGLMALGAGFKFLRRRMLNKQKAAMDETPLAREPSVEKCP
jgi:uncharacterized membrane protein YdjX (TVP38/TMEM64 family)